MEVRWFELEEIEGLDMTYSTLEIIEKAFVFFLNADPTIPCRQFNLSCLVHLEFGKPSRLGHQFGPLS